MSSEVSTLELRASSEGIRVANERLEKLAIATAAAERASQQFSVSAEKMAQAQLQATARAVAAAERAAQSKVAAAEKAAQRQAEVATKAAAREVEIANRAAARKAEIEARKAEAEEKAALRRSDASLRKQASDQAQIDREYRSLEARLAKGKAAEARKDARENEAWERAIAKARAAEDRKTASVERSAQRQAEIRERVLARENEGWDRSIARAKAAENRKLENVKRQLMTEEQMIRQSEEERRKIILRSTQLTQAQRNEMLRASNAKMQSQLGGGGRGGGGSGFGSGVAQGLGVAALAGGVAGITAMAFGEIKAQASALWHDVINTTREFDRLNASLITVTGSSKEADRVFAILQQFAATTPFQLQETVQAFVQLRTLGLSATERSLRAYGDMASAFGDSLDHMLLAVTDAAMGINRPLKQFGIWAEAAVSKSQKLTEAGDKVRFTYRGITTEVRRDTQSIEDYLVKLSEAHFAGAMANRMKTLDGALSNLADNWHKFELAVVRSGIEDALTKIVIKMTDLLEKLEGIAKKYGPQIKEAVVNTASNAAWNVASVVLPGGGATAASARAALGHMPEQKVITDEMLDRDKERLARYNADLAKINQERYREELRDLIKHLKTRRELITEEYEAALKIIDSKASGNPELDTKLFNAATKKYKEEIAALDKKDSSGYRRDKGEFDRMVKAVQKKEDPIQEAQDEYNKRNAMIERFTKKSSMLRFRLQQENHDLMNKEIDDVIAAQTKELEAVESSLKGEEESVRESYEKRRRIVDQESQDSDERARLQKALEQQLGKQLFSIRENAIREREALDDELLTEEEHLVRSYERRRREIASSTVGMSAESREGLQGRHWQRYEQEQGNLQENKRLDRVGMGIGYTNDQGKQLDLEMQREAQKIEEARQKDLKNARYYDDLKIKLAEQTARKKSDLDREYAKASAENAATLFGNLATTAKNWGGEQSAAYKTMFATQKAFAIAAGTLNMFQDISNASATPYPGNIPLMIKAAAEGAGLLAQISSVNYAGAYDRGGNIPAGRVGLVGEYGPEFVRGPANVTSRADTARMVREAASGAGSGGQAPTVNVRSVNVFGEKDVHAATRSFLGSAEGDHVIVNLVRRNSRQIKTLMGVGG